jgi:formylglycine-generating enzyme required for sulfatase activity
VNTKENSLGLASKPIVLTVTVIVAAITCLWAVAFAAGDKKVAVLELVNKAGITDDEAYFLTDKVRRTASGTLPVGQFTIMTSENIQELLPPGKDLAKCTDAQCEVEIGRNIGAEYIVTGEIIRYAGKLRVQVKVHHVPTGHFLGSADTQAGDLEQQESMLSSISATMMNKVLSHAGVTAPSQRGGGAVFVAPTQPSTPRGAAEVRTLPPTEQPPATATGPAGLYITSNPPGADVYLGQTKAGTTSPAFQKVNLQAGTNVRVTLKMNLYHDVSFDVALKPGVMKFEGVELKPAFGSLKIESEPSGAEVYIGGEKVGTTPFSEQRYPSGKYLVNVKKHLFYDAVFSMNLESGSSIVKNFELKPAFGSLKIDSEPTGANVYIAGDSVGKTPFSNLRYPSGQYLVTIKKEWYLPIEDQQIIVGDGQATSKVFTLSQDFGTLDVASDPSGAEVTLDGKNLGITPGSWRVPPVQNGKVEVVLAKHHGKSFEITIDRDQTVKITAEQATLQAKVGSLQIYADPPEPGAKVFVDGKEIGTAPATVSALIEGVHTVKIKADQKEGMETVSIAEGQTAVVTIKLKNRGLVSIPGGWFVIGCSTGDSKCDSDEMPFKKIYVASFQMDAYEVTQSEYERVMGKNPSEFKGCANCPVENVSWNDSRSYCAKVGKRLPTEAEWEYAARGRTTGSLYSRLNQIAWYSNNSDKKTHPVGQKQPNVYGLYDMLGNVWEWCMDGFNKDWYSKMPERNPANSGNHPHRIVRGGGWNNNPASIRVSNRIKFEPTYWDNNMGFRCSKD